MAKQSTAVSMDFFLFQRFQILFLSFYSFLRKHLMFQTLNTKNKKQTLDLNFLAKKPSVEVKQDEETLLAEDVDILMKNLGLFCNQESEKIEEKLSFGEVSMMFEEEEPSVEEVREAFDVFDENRDGFVDAEELHRVLCVLGLQEGSKVESCKRMIQNFDENGDGRIDFNEFVKLMESRFCCTM